MSRSRSRSRSISISSRSIISGDNSPKAAKKMIKNLYDIKNEENL